MHQLRILWHTNVIVVGFQPANPELDPQALAIGNVWSLLTENKLPSVRMDVGNSDGENPSKLGSWWVGRVLKHCGRYS